MRLTTTAHAVIPVNDPVPGSLSAYRLENMESKYFLFISRPDKLLVPRKKEKKTFESVDE